MLERLVKIRVPQIYLPMLKFYVIKLFCVGWGEAEMKAVKT